MSEVTNTQNNTNAVFNDFDLSKIFVFNNRFKNATFKNNTGGPLAFLAGTLLARDSSDNTIVPLLSTKTTLGLNIPVGILHNSIASIADAATVTNQSFCIQGDVADGKILFQGADD